MSDEIVRYVKKNPASRFTEIRDYFRNVEVWSGGKFSYQWKKATKHLTKRFDSLGHPRYYLKSTEVLFKEPQRVTLFNAEGRGVVVGSIYSTRNREFYGSW